MTMKKYRETIAAGGMLEIEHPASFFTLLRAVSPLSVEFLKDYRVADRAEQMVAGLWFEPEVDFDRVRLWNGESYEVTVEFLLSKGRSGWSLPPPSCMTLETSASGVAANQTVVAGPVDLGEDWASCVLTAQVDGLVASSGGNMQVLCADYSTMTGSRLAVGQGFSGVAYTVTTTTNHHMSSLRPTGRFVRASYYNGSVAQPAGSARLMLHVMRNVTA